LKQLNDELLAEIAQLKKENHALEETLKQNKSLSQLKSILKMTSDVSEYLVGAMSLESIAKYSIERISEHEDYKYCCFGTVLDDEIFFVHESNSIYSALGKSRCSKNSKYAKSELFKGAFEAVETISTVIKTDLIFDESCEYGRRESGFLCKTSISIPLVYNAGEEPFAVINIFTKKNGIDKEEKSILENLVSDIALAINIDKHRTLMEELKIEKISNYEETILAFVEMIEQRDAYTAGHTVRVAQYCRLIAKQMSIEEKDIIKLEKAAVLHDIGKVVTPDSILLKPAKLTEVEYNLIKDHAESGYKMLSKIKMYEELAQIIRYHHEYYDGNGYPDGKKGDEIDILTHILIVADAFDAMTTNRIYQAKKTIAQALEEISLLNGKQFHPEVCKHVNNALSGVDISATDQLPHSDLEQNRLLYFFNDSLTGVYNEHYLNLILNQDFHEHIYLNVLFLRNFSEYNKLNGWNSGNELLKNIATFLRKRYARTLIFRFHGDEFIVLSDAKIDFSLSIMKDFKPFETKEIDFEVKSFETVDFANSKELLEEIL